MAEALAFKLITPLAVKFEGDAELVIATTTEGEEGILPKHAPFLSALRPGVLRANVRDAAGGVKRLELATSEGFMQALPDRVTVLVDEAVASKEVDIPASKAELDAATERQRAAGNDMAAYAREQRAIDFATAKLKISGALG